MSNSTSYAPPGEDAAALWIERSNLDGIVVGGVAYGVLFTLTFQTLVLFFQFPRSQIPWGLVTYSVVMFCLATIGFGGLAKWNEMTFIDDRNFPGGPLFYTFEGFVNPVNLMNAIVFSFMTWLADALVLWRFHIIWGKNYWISLFPAIMLLGSIVSSIIATVGLFDVNLPFTSFVVSTAYQWSIAYWSLSVSLTIILTASIIVRIWLVRRRVKNMFGEEHSAQYVSVAAMLIESAALYAVWGIIYIISFALNSPLENITHPILYQVQGIAPILILFRVAQGRAWSHTTLTANANESSRLRTKHSIPMTSFNTVGETSLPGHGVKVVQDTVLEWPEAKDPQV